MRVQVFTKSEQPTNAALFEAMHRQRHHVFAVELGWSDLRSPDGLEVDQFDDDHARYLIAHEGDEVFGSLRLLPAWRRSMLSECWPAQLAPAERTMEGGVWEWTRWCPGSTARPRALLSSRRALILAAVEFGQREGAHRFVTLCETKFVEQLEALGWAPRPLGPAFAYAEGVAIGVGWTARPNALVETAARLRSPRAPRPTIRPADLERAA